MTQNQYSKFLNPDSKISLFIFILCTYGITLFNSCKKDTELVKTFVKPNWEFKLHKNGTQSNSILRANIISEDKVILATTNGPDNRFITGININSGTELWNWNNIYQPPTEYFDIRYTLIYNSLMFYQVGTRSYCINLLNGNTHFKKRGDISYDGRFSGYLSNAILLGDIQDQISGETAFGAYTMDIQTGTITPLLLPPFDSTSINTEYHGQGDFSNIAITDDGQYLVTTYAFVDSNNHVISKLGLYNLTESKWTYFDIHLSDNPQWYTSVFHIPVIYNNKIFMNIGKSLICHDFMTGQKIWTREFPHDFLFSGYIVEGK